MPRRRKSTRGRLLVSNGKHYACLSPRLLIGRLRRRGDGRFASHGRASNGRDTRPEDEAGVVRRDDCRAKLFAGVVRRIRPVERTDRALAQAELFRTDVRVQNAIGQVQRRVGSATQMRSQVEGIARHKRPCGRSVAESKIERSPAQNAFDRLRKQQEKRRGGIA